MKTPFIFHAKKKFSAIKNYKQNFIFMYIMSVFRERPFIAFIVFLEGM